MAFLLHCPLRVGIFHLAGFLDLIDGGVNQHAEAGGEFVAGRLRMLLESRRQQGLHRLAEFFQAAALMKDELLQRVLAFVAFRVLRQRIHCFTHSIAPVLHAAIYSLYARL